MSSPPSQVCVIHPSLQAWAEEQPKQAMAAFALAMLLIGWMLCSSLLPSLQSLYEMFFQPVPKIVLNDLPSAVTSDNDGAKSESPTNGKQHPPLQNPKRPNYIQCYDPSTLQWLGEVPAMTTADVHQICAQAAAAQRTWRHTTYAQRRQVLRTLQQYICTHTREICRASARDSGKPLVDAALGEVLTTCEKIRTVLAHGEAWLQPERRPTGPMLMHKVAQVEYDTPLGVIGTIAPWNYPYVLRVLCVLLVGWIAGLCVWYGNGELFLEVLLLLVNKSIALCYC